MLNRVFCLLSIMSENMQIFCDESGFTGNDLFSNVQPYFIYSSIAIYESEAKEIINEVKGNRVFHIQGDEVKGKNLIKYAKGRKAMNLIIDRCIERSWLIFHHKKYALSGKFFEYMFEPLLSEVNSFFYKAGFHKFVANTVYHELLKSEDHSHRALLEFQELMRGNTDTKYFFKKPEENILLLPNIKRFLEFIHIHKDAILEDYGSYNAHPPLMRWMLDLTQTSLFCLLAHWGQVHDVLEVHCDSSNPLQENKDLFDGMIGRTEKVKEHVFGKEHHLTFNLSKQIEVNKSNEFCGLQIADVFATGLNYALLNPEGEYAKEWKIRMFPFLDESCTAPEPDLIDIKNRDTLVNSLILEELMERSKNGKSLITDWETSIKDIFRTVRLGMA